MKSCTAHAPTQKVVVVNGSAEALSVLETLLDAGHYDMVFVESSDRAYSTIKRVLPNLIVVCTKVEARALSSRAPEAVDLLAVAADMDRIP